MDEAAGSAVGDSSGDAHDGTIQGAPTWVDGSPAGGSALAFHGGDDEVVVRAPGFALDGSFTLTAWVKTSIQSAPSVVASLGTDGCYGPVLGMLTSPPYANPSAAWTNSGGANQQAQRPNESIFSDGHWHLMAVTFANGASAVGLNVDGHTIPVGQPSPLSLSTGGPGFSDLDFRIGGYGAACPAAFAPFVGAIDDVRLYDHALTQAEVAALIPPYETTSQFDGANGWSYGMSIELWAYIYPYPPSGTAEFFASRDGGPGVSIGKADVGPNFPAARLDVSNTVLGVGTSSVYFVYSGYGPAGGSTSNATDITVDPDATNLGLSANGGSDTLPGSPITLTASVSYALIYVPGIPVGSVEFFDDSGGSPVSLGSADLSGGVASIQIAGRPAGSYPFRAVFAPADAVVTGSTGTTSLNVSPGATQVALQVAPTSVDEHAPAQLTASAHVLAPAPGRPDDGVLALVDTATGTTLASGPGSADLKFTYAPAGAGLHTIKATYTGSQRYQDGSAQVDLWVSPNTVDASGVGASYSTFYPYKDGYRDTVALRGTRLEAESVAIRVYNGSNRVVFAKTVARASGAYSVAWNGRTAAGAMLVAGRYRVVQTLTDAWGLAKSFTTYVTLSSKRLVKSTITMSRSVSQATKRTTAWAVWKFSLPSADAYTSIRGYAFGRSVNVPGGRVGPQDFRLCGLTTYSPDCASPTSGLGFTTAWYSVGVSPTHNVSRRIVLLYVFASPGGSVTVSSVKLTVTYGFLR